MLRDDGGSGGAVCFEEILMRLASALDCSIEDFYKAPSIESDQTLELFHLWSKIHHVQDRNKVLGFIRTTAEKQF